MLITDSEIEWEIVREPLECCSGQRAIAAALHSVDGRTLHIVFVQHDLWCCAAPPLDD